MKTKNRLSVAALVAFLLIGAVARPSFASTPRDALDHYLAVQSALARDSMQHVSARAHALAAAVRGDETKSLPAVMADQAEALAQALSLDKARKAFDLLSQSLIAYLKSHNAPPGTYYQVYCPITKASWLQTGATVRNPYLGPRSATPTWGWACAGVVKAKFENPSSGKSQN